MSRDVRSACPALVVICALLLACKGSNRHQPEDKLSWCIPEAGGSAEWRGGAWPRRVRDRASGIILCLVLPDVGDPTATPIYVGETEVTLASWARTSSPNR